MLSEFDETPERKGSGSLKWDVFRGRDVLPFWVADMDFRSPPEVVAALRQRVEHGVYGYAMATPEDEEAVLDYLDHAHGVKARRNWLVWLPGLVPAKSAACRMAKQLGGDSVMIATPVYPPFHSAPGDADLDCLKVPLRRGDDGRLTFDFTAMEKALQPATRMFILCNPHNPVGRVFRREELESLFRFCERHNLILCSDEIHCDLIFDPKTTPHVSALHFGEAAHQRIISLFAASKTYNIAGIGCAFAVIPDAKLRSAFQQACGGWLPPVNAFGYVASTAAYRHGEPWRRRLLAYLEENRRQVFEHFQTYHPKLSLEPMEATYLAWIDARPLGLESPQAHFTKHGIGLSDGADFGAPGFLRLNFACPRAWLREGLDRFHRAVEALP